MQGHFLFVSVINTALIHQNPDAHGHNLNGMNEGIKRARRVSDMAWPLLHGMANRIHGALQKKPATL